MCSPQGLKRDCAWAADLPDVHRDRMHIKSTLGMPAASCRQPLQRQELELELEHQHLEVEMIQLVGAKF